MECQSKIPLAVETAKTKIPGNEPSISLILKENAKRSEPENNPI
jgi:hypothetical protein